MIKVIDLDNLFDKYIEDYVYKNVGKLKPEQIENNIPILYEKFGKENNANLDGKCPEEYYKSFEIEELLGCLKEHIKSGVSISDYLCEAISAKKENERALIDELKNTDEEEYAVYLMNMLGDMGAKLPLKLYLEYVLYQENPTIVEVATEYLSENAESIKEEVLASYEICPTNRKSNLVEILSNTKKDDRVFDILISEFVKNQDEVAIYAGYLAKFEDERALPFLLKAIENEKINYADFEELRFAIESLGGEYDKKRDFSQDRFYKQIVKIKK